MKSALTALAACDSNPVDALATGPQTPATVAKALGACHHPAQCLVPARVLEPEGGPRLGTRAVTISVAWCGACGAMRIGTGADADWIRPAIALVAASVSR